MLHVIVTKEWGVLSTREKERAQSFLDSLSPQERDLLAQLLWEGPSAIAKDWIEEHGQPRSILYDLEVIKIEDTSD